jgi:hypothetical protein
VSRLEVPLVAKNLKTTGEDLVRAELLLELKTNQGTWAKVLFRVDPGTEMTTMAAEEARSLDLPIPKRPVRGLSFQGKEVRPGLLRTRVLEMDATQYVFPCYFLGDPNVPIPKTTNLLGLTGVINQIRLTFDGATSLIAPYGILVVEKR